MTECEDCQYWSLILTRSEGGRLAAMCLCKESPRFGRYALDGDTCQYGEPGDPIDSTGSGSDGAGNSK